MRCSGLTRTSDRPQVETILLDAADQGGGGARSSDLAEEPTLAGGDVQQGGGSHLGTSGGSNSRALRGEGPADDALRRADAERGSTFSERLKPWSRGQTQLLKQGVKSVKTAIESLTLVAQTSVEPTWKVLEIFGGSAALSLVARSTGCSFGTGRSRIWARYVGPQRTTSGFRTSVVLGT